MNIASGNHIMIFQSLLRHAYAYKYVHHGPRSSSATWRPVAGPGRNQRGAVVLICLKQRNFRVHVSTDTCVYANLHGSQHRILRAGSRGHQRCHVATIPRHKASTLGGLKIYFTSSMWGSDGRVIKENELRSRSTVVASMRIVSDTVSS
jgi:hypothetical protein